MKNGIFIAAYIIFGIIVGVGPIFAQLSDSPEAVITLTDNDIRTCQEYALSLQGPTAVKLGHEQSYSLQSTIPEADISSISHEVWKDDQFIEEITQGTFQYSFPELGEYLIKSLVNTNSGCTYVSQELVSTYENIFLYIGGGSEEFDLIKDSLQAPDTLLESLTIDNATLQRSNDLVDRLVDNKSLIENADSIIVDSQSLGAVLGAIPYVERISPIDISNIHMYVISTINNSAFRRLVGTYSALSGIKEINVIPQNSLGSLVNGLLLGRSPQELGFVKQYSTETNNQSRWLFMSYFVDSLLVDGVPLQTILLLLLLPVLGLIVAFFRHVIGFSTYGVFASVLLGLAFYTIGRIPTVTFVITGLLAVVLTTIIVRNIYLLSTAKQALMLSLYALLLIVVFVAQNKRGRELFSIEQFNNVFVMFLIMYVLIVSNSLFKETTQLFKRKWLYKIFQFTVVIVTVLGVFYWDWLHNVLLLYPEFILLVLFLIVMVGRYTGLQITEYLRFKPLIIWNLNQHEEE